MGSNYIQCKSCEYEENCSVRELAPDITGCSGHSRLHHRFEEKKEQMQKEAIEHQQRATLRNEAVLASIRPGDKVQLIATTPALGLRLPRYLDYGTFCVLGIHKNGKIICDWDGGKPFLIPPGCLEKVEDNKEEGGEKS